VLLLVAGLLLLTGCRLTPETSPGKKNAADDLASAVNLTDREQHSRAKAHAHFGAGVIHEMNGDNDAALAEYVQAAREDVDDEELLLDVCRRLLVLKRMDEALSLLESAAKRPGMSEQVFVRLGVVYAQQGRQPQAVAACEKAIQKAPHSIVGYQALFVAYLQALKQDHAFKVLQRANQQYNAPPEFYIVLADLYSKFATQVPNRREAARSAGLDALRKAEATASGSVPLTPGIGLALADGYVALGAQEKAAELYQRVLQALPNAPGIRERVQARLTEIYLRKDDRKRAAEHLLEIVKQDPTNPQAWYLLGAIAFEDKKYTDAEEFYRKALLLNPEAEQAYYDLASTLINLGKTSEAISLLQTARSKFEAGFPMEFLTGMAFSRQQGFTEAMRHFIAAEVIARATDPARLNEFFFFQLVQHASAKATLNRPKNT
jgi:tetratricopeptide (TPR) repeat protein